MNSNQVQPNSKPKRELVIEAKPTTSTGRTVIYLNDESLENVWRVVASFEPDVDLDIVRRCAKELAVWYSAAAVCDSTRPETEKGVLEGILADLKSGVIEGHK
jgi:hypothetical protein